MARTSTRTRARTGFDVDEFNVAFMAADFDRCRALTTHIETPRAILAASRVAIRERRYVDAIGALSKFSGSAPERVERDILLGAALGHTKDYVAATRLLDRALAQTRRGEADFDDAIFYKSLIAWMEHEHRQAEDLIGPQLESDDPNQRARAHILRSWIAARRRDLPGQVRELETALDEIEAAAVPDEYYRSNALVTLALLCRELPLPDLSRRVRCVHKTMRWSSGLRIAHFQVTRFLAWVDELDGNDLAAFGGFKSAAMHAPSDFWRVSCLLDRARLARHTGERAFAIDQLEEAHQSASKLSWSESVDEERSALLVLAELFSDVDAAIAQQYLARFRSLTTPVAPLLSYGTDPRVRAFEAYSAGIAHLRLGDAQEAERLLEEAWAIFEDFGYGWRAALCALNLNEATNDSRWLDRAKLRIAPWPRSWIARQIREARATAPPAISVPAAQRQVLNLLLSGKRNADIADALGRSPHTVRNQIAQLFKLFNVKTRAELVAILPKAPSTDEAQPS